MDQESGRRPDRLEACLALKEMGREAAPATEALAVALEDSDETVRLCAARALAAIGRDAKRAIEALSLAMNDQSELVRGAPVDALRAMCVPSPPDEMRTAVSSIMDALDDDSQTVRAGAAEILESMDRGMEDEVPAIREAIEEDVWDEEGSWALEAALAEIEEGSLDAEEWFDVQRGAGLLHIAAAEAGVAEVEGLVARGADVNARLGEGDGPTPLHEAAGSGNTPVVSLLLSAGAEVDASSFEGRTPLHRAAENGYLKAAEVLLAHGADVNAEDQHGRTPLYMASIRHFVVVELLFSEGASVSVTDSAGRTPLHAAAFGGEPRIVELLIEAGADVNAEDMRGFTPIRSAIINKNTEIIERLPTLAEDMEWASALLEGLGLPSRHAT